MRSGTRRSAWAALVVALGVVAAHAGGDGATPPDAPRSPAQINAAFVADARKAFEPLRPKLEALGEWCGASSLFLQRARIAETLLAFDPEHERARLWLRFKKQKDGTWQQTSARPFSDDNPDAMPECKTRRAEVEGALRDALLPMVDTVSWETAGGRTWLLHGLLAMNPDDAELHDKAGETLVAKRWILKESAATVEGRRSLREAARKAVKSTEHAAIAHPVDPGWTTTSKLDLVTVRTNQPQTSADEIAVRSSQAVSLLRLVLGEDFQPPKDLQIVVLAGPAAEFSQFLANRAARSAADRDELTRQGGVEYIAKQGGSWVAVNEYVCSMYTQPDRVDSIVREVLNAMDAPCGRIVDAPPWLFEGAGMYLTYALLGTRLTTLHDKSAYSNQEVQRALASEPDWTAALRAMVAKGFDPKIPAVLTAPLNSLTREDTLVSYVLAAYLLEGCGSDLRRILERMHAGVSVHQAVAEVCGVDSPGLQERFVRWLRETK